MPSLLPTRRKTVDAPAIDLQRVFMNDANQQSLSRVLNYLRQINAKFSNRSREDLDRENTITEEFFLCMPTEAAFLAEIRLCAAIEDHAAGKASDSEIKTVLESFVATHTFVYQDNSRDVKVGVFSRFAECELFYLRDSSFSLGFICNAIQVCLLKFIYSDLKLSLIKL